MIKDGGLTYYHRITVVKNASKNPICHIAVILLCRTWNVGIRGAMKGGNKSKKKKKSNCITCFHDQNIIL